MAVPVIAVTIVLMLTRLCLTAAFALAGASKLGAPKRTRRSLQQFGVAARFAGMFGTGLAMSELSVASGLVFPGTVHIAAAAALVLLGLFATAVSVNLWQGRRPECACFGGISSSPIGPWTLGRNLLFAAAGVVVLVGDPSREFVTVDASTSGSLPGIIVLIVALNLGLGALGLSVVRRRRRKGRMPDLASKASSPRRSGLAVGTATPHFELILLDGGVATREWLTRNGRAVLLVFASPSCGQCAALLPALAALQEEARELLRSVLICAGTVEATHQLLGACPVALAATDEKGHVARRFRIGAFPSAVLISPHGLIASETASGARQVANLLARLSRTAALQRPEQCRVSSGPDGPAALAVTSAQRSA